MVTVAKKSRKIVTFISVISILFFLAIAFDISPFLRGPAPYPPDWRWEYFFVNTVRRVWFPGMVIICLLTFAYFLEAKPIAWLNKNEKKIIVGAIGLGFLLQMSVLYFSRSGISVLIHRIINPDLNGYFTAATKISNISDLLRNYNDTVLKLPMHAQGHPPGAILFFWVINKLSVFLPDMTRSFSPTHGDVLKVWRTLLPAERTGAVLAGFLIPLLSMLTLIPIYKISKYLYNVKVAVRGVFLYISVPSIVLFIPINDVFLPLFVTTAFLFFIKGIQTKSVAKMFTSGFLFACSLFFSLSLLPLLVLFFLYYALSAKRSIAEPKTYFAQGVFFAFGLFLLPFLLLLFFHFNFFAVSKTLMSGLPKERKYFVWVFYNLYDFFVFVGIPLFLLTIICLKSSIQQIIERKYASLDKVFVAFVTMLLFLDISGSVRGEVGRIWIPFVPFLIIPLANFLTTYLKFSKNNLLLLLALQLIQVLVMQEVWVMLW
jgi:hypothetical protein